MSRLDRVAENLATVRRRIEQAGGGPESIQIVAVTKGRPVEDCRAAVRLGLTTLGENRVQEALTKLDEVPGAHWHLVGHLQSNKAKHAARFELVQSLDSLHLAELLASMGGGPPVLLEVNVAREANKHGARPEDAVEMAAAVSDLLDLRGLMAMAPLHGDAAPAFGELRGLRDAVEQRTGRELPVLSMGMSEDLEAAVREGTTMVRLGRALFD